MVPQYLTNVRKNLPIRHFDKELTHEKSNTIQSCKSGHQYLRNTQWIHYRSVAAKTPEYQVLEHFAEGQKQEQLQVRCRHHSLLREQRYILCRRAGVTLLVNMEWPMVALESCQICIHLEGLHSIVPILSNSCGRSVLLDRNNW